jgi:hypothetical protein
MRKLKLKEDIDGNKTTTVNGIRAACKVMKTRYSKPFEAVQVKIPYETGMDPYSGLLDLFEAKGLLTKQGNRLKYTTTSGEEMLEFRKGWTGEKLEAIMKDVSDKDGLSIDDIAEAKEYTEENTLSTPLSEYEAIEEENGSTN